MRDPEWMDDTIRSPRAESEESQQRERGSRWSQIPPRVWAFAFIAAILLFALFGFWALYIFRGRLGGAQGPTPTAIIWTPTPSPTPAVSATPVPTETPETGEPGSATPTAASNIQIGGYVRVTGTGGYGLSLREGPGSNYARVDIANEDEIFIVVDGPQMSGGSPWWRIRDPDNEERAWWAAGNYLEAVEHP